MKTLIVLATVLFASVAMAASNVSFRWQPNTEPDLIGYEVLRSETSGGPYTMVLDIPCGPGDDSCAKGTELGVPDGTYYWVAIAKDSEGHRSGYSEEATRKLDSTPPAPPQGFQIIEIVVAAVKKAFEWLAGWFGGGFRISS